MLSGREKNIHKVTPAVLNSSLFFFLSFFLGGGVNYYLYQSLFEVKRVEQTIHRLTIAPKPCTQATLCLASFPGPAPQLI